MESIADHPATLDRPVEADSPPASAPFLSTRPLLALWVLAGALLFVGLGASPVKRSQEARVLETAREMLGAGWRNWLIPHANGIERLHKPPLAYWLTAIAYKIAGVSLTAGRAPTALAGWFTLLLTFLAARWLFGVRAAFFAAAALLGSYMFFHFSHLAETDPLATLFVTASVYWFWKAPGRESASGGHAPPGAKYLHLGAAAMGLAVLAKGPPALYAALFLVSLAATSRRWDLLRRFLTSGAIVTFAVVALPWFAYVHATVGLARIQNEAEVVLLGRDHKAPVYDYLAYFFIMPAPWSAFVGLGVYEAARRCTRDPRLRGVLLWAGATFVPLLLIPQRQLHYLNTLMPPLMILVGWLIDRGLRPDEHPGLRRAVRLVLAITIIASFAGGPAVLWGAKTNLGHIRPTDWAFAVGVVAAFAPILWICRTRGLLAGAFAYATAAAACVTIAYGIWGPTLERANWDIVAAAIRQETAARPAIYYGSGVNLRLCFYLRSTIRIVGSPAEVAQALTQDPRTVVVVLERQKHKDLGLPEGLQKRGQSMHVDEEVVEVYRAGE
jgi:4-amino-4-deoxy-L-arabinose transferase-like glycosyltransferase